MRCITCPATEEKWNGLLAQKWQKTQRGCSSLAHQSVPASWWQIHPNGLLQTTLDFQKFACGHKLSRCKEKKTTWLSKPWCGTCRVLLWKPLEGNQVPLARVNKASHELLQKLQLSVLLLHHCPTSLTKQFGYLLKYYRN